MARNPATPPSEVERKFLVHDLPDDLDRFPGVKMRQGYLAIDGDTEVRVRAEGKKYFLTVKTGHGESRQEVQRRISKKDFAALWPLTRGRRVWKRRYRIPYGKRTIELDVYRRQLKGLRTAEVEFPDRDKADTFRPPAWLGPEVTGDERFSNQNLARCGREVTEDGEYPHIKMAEVPAS